MGSISLIFNTKEVEDGTKVLTIFGNTFKDISNSISKKSNIINQWITDFDGQMDGSLWDNLFPKKDKQENIDQLVKQFKQLRELVSGENALSLGEAIDQFEELDECVINFANSNDISKTSTEQFTNSLKQQTLSAKAGQLALKGLAMAGNMVVAALATWAFTAVIKGIDNYINRVKYAKEALEEFNSEIESRNDTIKSHADLIEKAANSYDELAKKVDTNSNLNLGLDESEYKEFINLSNELAEAFPTLVKDYDKKGNAILDFGDDCDTAREKLEQLLDKEKEANRLEINKNLPEAFNNVKTVLNGNSTDIKNTEKNIEGLVATLETLRNLENKDYEIIDNKVTFSTEGIDPKAQANVHNTILQTVENFKSELTDSEKIAAGQIFNFNQQTGEIWLNLLGLGEDQRKDLLHSISNETTDIVEYINDTLGKARMELDLLNTNNENIWGDFLNNLAEGMQIENSYKQLDEESKKLAQSVVKNLDISLKDEIDDDPYDYVRDNIISVLQTVQELGKSNNLSTLMNDYLTLDISNMTVTGQMEAREKLIDTIKQILPDDIEQKVIVALGLDIETELESEYNRVKATVEEKFGKTRTAQFDAGLDKYSINTVEELARLNGYISKTDSLTKAFELYSESIATVNKELKEQAELFSSFEGTALGERLAYLKKLFEEGEISYREYFEGLQNEINNVDFSEFTDEVAAAKQFFTDNVQQSASGLSTLINSFDSGEIGVTEYLDSYLAIADTVSLLTDNLQENAVSWDKNGEAIDSVANASLDKTQSAMQDAMGIIESYQDSIYSMEQIMSGAIETGTDEFSAHVNVIAQDLANIVATGGEMANEIANTLGTTTSEIAKNMTDNVSNQSLAAQAIATNTNSAISSMAKSIGELFRNLGNAISNFKVDLDFGIKKISKQEVDILGKKINLPKIEFSLEASGNSLKTIGSAVSSFGQSIANNLKPQMIELPDFSFGNTEAGKNSNYKVPQNITKNYEKALDNIKDSASEAAESVKEAFEETFDFFDRRVKVLSNALSLLETNMENVTGAFAKNNLIDAQIGINAEKVNNYTDAMAMYTQKANEALSKLPSDIQSKIKDGAVDLTTFIGDGNEEVVEAINEYSQWADKVADCKQELAGLKEAIRDLELEKFNNIMQDFTDQFDLREGSKDLIDKQIALFKEAGQLIGESFFNAKIDQTKKQLAILEEEKNKLAEQMTSAVTSGRIEVGTDEWLEMVNSLKDVEGSILDAKTALEEFDNALLELHTEVFNRIQEQFSNIDSELENLRGLFDTEKVSDGYGNWNKEALVQLGMLTQQYELARYQVEQYDKEIALLNQQYLEGRWSATEYADRLAELSSAQWDAVNSSEDIKDAIMDLNETRINESIETIEKEIEKYKELIDAQIEALKAAKDLHDYKESIAEKNKSINDLERQIAAMQNDTTASTVAKRKLLEEQLAEAKKDLKKEEYDHSIEEQEKALNKEFERYEAERNAEIEALRESLEDKEAMIFASFEAVKQNAILIGQELVNMATMQGISISNAIITSWQNGETAIASYGSVLNAATSSFIGQIMGVENEVYMLQNQANVTADSLAWMFATRADNLVGQLTASYYSEQNLNAMTNALRDSLINTLERGYNISSITSAFDQIANAASNAASAARDAANAIHALNSSQSNFPSSSSGGYKIINGYNGQVLESGLSKSEADKLWKSKYLGNAGSAHIVKYASGTRNSKGGIAVTDEEGYEYKLARIGRGKYTPLAEGSQVFTKEQTDKLYELSKSNISSITPLKTGVADRDISKPVNSSTVQVGTLIKVEGNVDSSNIKQMENIANKAVDRLVNKMSAGIKYRNF